MADAVVLVKAVAKGDNGKNIQLGANLFEQTLLILCDAIVIGLLDGKDIEFANRELIKRHANLE